MPRRRPQVPCSDCIERASKSAQQTQDTQLCSYCIAATNTRNSKNLGPVSNHVVQPVLHRDATRSSLLLLKIHQMAQGADGNPNSSTSSSPTHRSEVSKLESYSRAMITAVNDRDFTNPIFTSLASPDHRSGPFDIFPATTTISAHIDNFRQLAEQSPSYHMEIEDISTDLEGGEPVVARVYCATRVTGRPPGLERGAIGVFVWSRRREGEGWPWELVANENWRTWGMRCPPTALRDWHGHNR